MNRQALTILTGAFLLVACGSENVSIPEKTNGSPPKTMVSGFEFLTESTQAQQKDSFENPGYFWVDQGQKLFTQAPANGASCAACHESGLEGVAASYPALDEQSGQLINLEGRINLCRSRHQNAEPFEYESEDLLALTSYVANQSAGTPINVEVSPETEENYRNGEEYFFTRRGQFNLSCDQCHNQNWGKKLRGDTISQGHVNGFPAYRFEWQTLGSLHRRLHDCDTGVRAQPFPLGSQTYIDLEYYLAVRSSGLEIETPAIRR